jgi:L-alanine-DL-glutamate epimerase-like enolase superfamily enzyme
VNRHTSFLYGGGREDGLGGGQRPTGVEIALWDLIGKAANQPLYKLWGGTIDRIVPYFDLPQGPGLGVAIRKDLYEKSSE